MDRFIFVVSNIENSKIDNNRIMARSSNRKNMLLDVTENITIVTNKTKSDNCNIRDRKS